MFSRKLVSQLSIATLACGLCACNMLVEGAPNAPDPAPDPAPGTKLAAPPKAASPKAVPPTRTALDTKVQDAILVPSPIQIQRALTRAGITEDLGALVENKTFGVISDDKNVIAVRTGCVLAYALLTAKDAKTPALLHRMGDIEAGLTALGADAHITATIDDTVDRLNSDTLTRDDLLTQLEETHGSIVHETKYGAGKRVAHLIQAGSWLVDVNLVSQAVIKAKDAKAGSVLLRQPELADYFLDQVRGVGADGPRPQVILQIESTLMHIKSLSSKPALSLDDISEIQAQTAGVLALL